MSDEAKPDNANQPSTAAVDLAAGQADLALPQGGAFNCSCCRWGLLAMALSGLGLVGLGIDVIGEGVGASDKPPRWAVRGLSRPANGRR